MGRWRDEEYERRMNEVPPQRLKANLLEGASAAPRGRWRRTHSSRRPSDRCIT